MLYFCRSIYLISQRKYPSSLWTNEKKARRAIAKTNRTDACIVNPSPRYKYTLLVLSELKLERRTPIRYKAFSIKKYIPCTGWHRRKKMNRCSSHLRCCFFRLVSREECRWRYHSIVYDNHKCLLFFTHMGNVFVSISISFSLAFSLICWCIHVQKCTSVQSWLFSDPRIAWPRSPFSFFFAFFFDVVRFVCLLDLVRRSLKHVGRALLLVSHSFFLVIRPIQPRELRTDSHSLQNHLHEHTLFSHLLLAA